MPFQNRQAAQQPSSPFKAPARLMPQARQPDSAAMGYRTADPLEIKVASKSQQPRPSYGDQANQTPAIDDEFADDDYTSLDDIDPLDSGLDQKTLPVPSDDVSLPDLDSSQPREEGLDESEFLPTVRNASLKPTKGGSQATSFTVPVGDAGTPVEEPKKRSLFARKGRLKAQKQASPDLSGAMPVPDVTATGPLADGNADSLPSLPVGDSVTSTVEDVKPRRARHSKTKGDSVEKPANAKAGSVAPGINTAAVIGVSLASAGAVLSLPFLVEALVSALGLQAMSSSLFMGAMGIVAVVSLVLGIASLKDSKAAGVTAIILSLVMVGGVLSYSSASSSSTVPASLEGVPSEDMKTTDAGE